VAVRKLLQFPCGFALCPATSVKGISIVRCWYQRAWLLVPQGHVLTFFVVAGGLCRLPTDRSIRLSVWQIGPSRIVLDVGGKIDGA